MRIHICIAVFEVCNSYSFDPYENNLKYILGFLNALNNKSVNYKLEIKMYSVLYGTKQ